MKYFLFIACFIKSFSSIALSYPSFSDGLSLLEKEDYKNAGSFFGKYTVSYSTDSRGFNCLGFSFYKLGRSEDALANYLKAIALDNKYATAYNNAGIIYFSKKDFQQARIYFEKAIELKPDYAKALINLGRVFLETGDKKKAKECLNKAKKADNNYFQTRLKSAKEKYGANLDRLKP